MALGNHFLCLDNLNLPTASLVKKLKDLEPELSATYFQKAIAPQLETFERRQAFRQGNISKAFELHQTEIFSQSEYFQLWMKHLPFIDDSLCKTELSRMIEAPHIVWKNYRLHTLLIDARYEEDEDVKISEQIDRLYMWLWRWMVQPQNIPTTVIENCWTQLNARRMCSQSTAEDFMLVRTCLRWTRLFDTRWSSPSQEWLQKSTPPSLKEPPLFRLEGQVLDCFEALKEKNSKKAATIYKTLQQDELFNSPHLFFKELLAELKGKESTLIQVSEFGKKLTVRLKARRVCLFPLRF